VLAGSLGRWDPGFDPLQCIQVVVAPFPGIPCRWLRASCSDGGRGTLLRCGGDILGGCSPIPSPCIRPPVGQRIVGADAWTDGKRWRISTPWRLFVLMLGLWVTRPTSSLA